MTILAAARIREQFQHQVSSRLFHAFGVAMVDANIIYSVRRFQIFWKTYPPLCSKYFFIKNRTSAPKDMELLTYLHESRLKFVQIYTVLFRAALIAVLIINAAADLL